MGAIEPWHLILLLIVILVVVGPGKLPQVGKGIGEAMREFRKATGELGGVARNDAPPAPQPVAQVAPAPSSIVAPPPVAGQSPGDASQGTSPGQ